MADPTQFKKKIQEMLSQEYEISFLGDNFNKIVFQINNIQEENIYSWFKKIILEEISHLKSKINYKYKKWKTNELISFRYPFNIEGIEYRIILVKVKNSIYIEFHLGKHKYYDSLSKKLGLR